MKQDKLLDTTTSDYKLSWSHTPFDGKKLPSNSGVYLIVDDKASILYVGSSQNLKYRWYNHHRLHDCSCLGATKIIYALTRNYSWWERRLIKQYKPKLNGQTNQTL